MEQITRPPHVESDGDEAFDRLVSSVATRLEAGEPIDFEAIVAQSPEHADRLAQLLPALEAMILLDPKDLESHPTSTAPSESARSDNLGRTHLLGDFRILREVGRGGMGVVYEAEQMSLGRRVALKVLPFAALLGEQQLKRFKNEARAAATLKHPHIVSVYSVGCERGVHYYAMELIEGESLDRLIAQLRNDHGVGSPADREATTAPQRDIETLAAPYPTIGASGSPEYFRNVARLGRDAADALAHAHELGVIHRDIKPANLIVDRQGKVWITDFGLARIEADAGLTMTGDVLGTLRYMSPEQALGQGVIDPRADVYSLGVTLYELATLEPAHGGDDRRQLLRDLTTTDPRPLRELNPRIPVDLDTIVRKAIEREPADRYASARELAHDLNCFLASEPIRARPSSLASRMAKWSRRHVAVVWSAVAVLLVSTVVLTGASLVVARWYREASIQREMAKAQVIETERQREGAEAVSDLLHEMLWTADPDSDKGSEYTVREMLDSFSATLHERLDDQPEVRAALHLTIGRAYRRLNQPERAEFHTKACVDQRRAIFGSDHESVAEALVEYAWTLYERRDRAPVEETAAAAKEAVEIYRKAGSHPNALLGALNILQAALGSHARLSTGDFEETEAVIAEAIAIAGDLDKTPYPGIANILHDYAGVQQAQGKFAEAEATGRQALALHRRFHGNHRTETGWGLLILGDALRALRKFEEAEAHYREALSLFSGIMVSPHPYVQRAAMSTAVSLAEQGKWASIGPVLEAFGPTDTASAFATYHVALLHLGRNDEEAYRRECQSLLRRPTPPTRVDHTYWKAWASSVGPGAIDRVPAELLPALRELEGGDIKWHPLALGAYLYRLGEYEEAIASLQEASELPRGTVLRIPSTYARFFLAMAHHEAGDAEQAATVLDDAIAASEADLKEPDADLWWDHRLLLRLLREEAERLIIGPTANYSTERQSTAN